MNKLYREPIDKVLGGVCGGLGVYTNIDPIIFRILFVGLIFYPFPIILTYILCWVIIPKKP
jgi:phage shock protein C